jgi:hypothetical protein
MADVQEAQKTDGADDHKNDNHPFKVTVSYNGQDEQFEVKPDELTKKLLDQAIHAFGPIPQHHLLSLWNQNGAELKDDETISAAGVKPGHELLLKPSTVKGG